MIFQGISLPKDVNSALAKGELVVFVGAGISKPPPSSLPLFDGLVVKVGQEFGKNISKNEVRVRGEPNILSEWHDAGHVVHRAVEKIIGDSSSKPTELHQELFRIFKKSQEVRIVTTNFDNHLSTAARDVFPNEPIDEYFAPALPLGDDFQGLVYLHGSANKKPEKMVLTAEDFGKVYFTKGWAREFLLSLFSKFTVLFVGYSHSDVLISYLAHGLKHAGVKPRWSLISSDSSEEEKKHWKNLGILTEEYSIDERNTENRHHRLTEFFREWADFVNKPILDQVNRLRLTAKSKPPDDGATAEFVDYCIQDARLAQELCNSIEDDGWIDWMDKREYFKALFNDGKQGSDLNNKLKPNELVLARWLCSSVRKKYPETLLRIIRKHNEDFNYEFAKEFAHALWTDGDDFEDPRFNIWVELLLKLGANVIPPVVWAYILSKCKLPDNTGIALKIFDILTTPKIHLTTPFRISPDDASSEMLKVDYEIEWPQESDHWLKEIWEKIFKPGIPKYGDSLMSLSARQLSHAHLLLRDAGKVYENFDLLSRQRKSIAPHEQDHENYHVCLHVLVNAIREIVEYWTEHHPAKVSYYVDMWRESRIPIFTRFAIYGIGLNKSLTSDERIQWLLDNDFIYRSGLKKEVFDVLKNNYPSASMKVRKKLLARIKAGIPSEDQDAQTVAYKKFNILNWLMKSDDSCELLKTGLEEIKINHPDFNESEYPEFDSWVVKGGSVDPKEAFDFYKILSEPPSKYVDSMLAAKETSISKYRSYINKVGVFFQKDKKDKAWSEKLIQELGSRGILERQIWWNMFFVWRESIASRGDWERILGVIETLPEEREIYAAASHLISRGFWCEEPHIDDELIERGYAIISKAWLLCKDQNTESNSSTDDLLNVTINHEGGWIGEFWIHYASHLRQKAKEKWQGVPEMLKDQIVQAIQGTADTTTYARAAIIPWSAYLFSWDKEFAIEYLFPLFDFDNDPSIAKQTWQVYLNNRRLAVPKMEELLIDNYEKLLTKISTDSEWNEVLIKSNSLHHLGFHIVGLMMRVIKNPIESGFISRVIPNLSEDVRGSLARGMGEYLKELKPEELREKWDLWLKEYLENRINNIPSALTHEETKHIAEWCLNFNDLFPAMVELLEKMPLKGAFVYSLTKNLLDSPLIEKYPEISCRLCVIVMRAEDVPAPDDHLRNLLDRFNKLVPNSPCLTEFKEELYRRGWNPED